MAGSRGGAWGPPSLILGKGKKYLRSEEEKQAAQASPASPLTCSSRFGSVTDMYLHVPVACKERGIFDGYLYCNSTIKFLSFFFQ